MSRDKKNFSSKVASDLAAVLKTKAKMIALKNLESTEAACSKLLEKTPVYTLEKEDEEQISYTATPLASPDRNLSPSLSPISASPKGLSTPPFENTLHSSLPSSPVLNVEECEEKIKQMENELNKYKNYIAQKEVNFFIQTILNNLLLHVNIKYFTENDCWCDESSI